MSSEMWLKCHIITCLSVHRPLNLVLSHIYYICFAMFFFQTQYHFGALRAENLFLSTTVENQDVTPQKRMNIVS
jgi:hypothetical protein